MKIFAIAALLVSLLALPGCYVPPVWDIGDAINDTEWIKPGVTTKAQVVERFGEPYSDAGEQITYTGTSDYGIFLSNARDARLGQESWSIFIEFDAAEVVRSIDTSETLRKEVLRQIELRQKELPALAEQGDAEAQFELYRLGRIEGEGRKWLCRSAHGGHAPAQLTTGVNYKWGWGGKATDQVQAYLWYSLSAGNGHPTAKFEREGVVESMTPAQIAEAERLVREWKPDPTSCEAEGKTASK